MTLAVSKLRVDKWLWFARFYKTRGLASSQVTGGHIRVNGSKIAKASFGVTAGDVLTLPQGNQIRVVKVLQLGTRRGPAPEAQTLYEDLTEPKEDIPKSPKFEGKGRPTKRDRRMIDLGRAGELE
ncbi:RNA-binding S4 domain-containing protein [Thalassovita sp.]|jgi:ribosome-associated heat shock protein Hsp15|uniref:RNA-binding S4 domain-containing protein n=1 Tax=Thalassovita sp. TaxID=1979401 RepID=UPI003B5B53B8